MLSHRSCVTPDVGGIVLDQQRVDGLIGHDTYPGGNVTTVNQKVTISWMAWMKSFRSTGLVT
jgi:hypothetical protein